MEKYPKIIDALKKILLIYIAFLNINCASGELINPASSGNLIHNKAKDFKVCDNTNKYCVNESSVLRDIYNSERIEILNNIGLIGNKSVVQIIYSAKFYDGKDFYAIFLTQSNEISPTQGVATCHACRAKLGLAIYQYHNKWKIFSVESNLHDGGSYGQIGIEGNIKIYSFGTERFFITYDDSFMAQGYSSITSNIIAVNMDVIDSLISSSNVVKAYYRGYITTGESECGAKSDGIYWKGKLDLIKLNAITSNFKLYKQQYRCNVDKKEGLSTNIFTYDHAKRKYSTKD